MESIRVRKVIHGWLNLRSELYWDSNNAFALRAQTLCTYTYNMVYIYMYGSLPEGSTRSSRNRLRGSSRDSFIKSEPMASGIQQSRRGPRGTQRERTEKKKNWRTNLCRQTPRRSIRFSSFLFFYVFRLFFSFFVLKMEETKRKNAREFSGVSWRNRNRK